jgi:hypothetical protein
VWRFINERQENLGIDFFQEISSAIERIKKNPYQFPKSRKNLRRFTVARFPFIIFLSKKMMFVMYLLFFTQVEIQKSSERGISQLNSTSFSQDAFLAGFFAEACLQK